jgi:hypothetical protein
MFHPRESTNANLNHVTPIITKVIYNFNINCFFNWHRRLPFIKTFFLVRFLKHISDLNCTTTRKPQRITRFTRRPFLFQGKNG